MRILDKAAYPQKLEALVLSKQGYIVSNDLLVGDIGGINVRPAISGIDTAGKIDLPSPEPSPVTIATLFSSLINNLRLKLYDY